MTYKEKMSEISHDISNILIDLEQIMEHDHGGNFIHASLAATLLENTQKLVDEVTQ